MSSGSSSASTTTRAPRSAAGSARSSGRRSRIFLTSSREGGVPIWASASTMMARAGSLRSPRFIASAAKSAASG